MPSSSVLEKGIVRATDQDFDLVEDVLDAFRASHENAMEPELASFLPVATHPLYARILHQLIRHDMICRWQTNQPRRLHEYLREFPEAFENKERTRELIRCEFRLRVEAGEKPSLHEYDGELVAGLNAEELPQTIQGTIVFNNQDAPSDSPCDADPPVDEELLEFPTVGSEFLNFEIVTVIGQGAFATVFLARQKKLHDRIVVLKVSSNKSGDAAVLSQLLHTNIVPIYSLHTAESLHATCMPYLGTTTFADILREVQLLGVPGSGRYLVDTLHERSTRKSASNGSASDARQPCRIPVTPPEFSLNDDVLPIEPRTRLILDNLGSLSYQEAVLWLVGQLADGLAHAHERGILHRDIKPANVLLTNEGQPMLLDFNLAEDTKVVKSKAKSRLGGTLLYMSPEQMQAYGGISAPVDARSDIYSLGVILFEFLTGEFPFPVRTGQTRELIHRMLWDRECGPPNMRRKKSHVTPAVAAIVQKCLHPDVDRRYQRAGDLREDIERHLKHLPLKHAKERSYAERFQKWRRRHPRLASLTTVICAAAAAILALFLFAHVRGEKLKQHQAIETFNRFEENLDGIQFLFTSQSVDNDEVRQFLTEAHQSLMPYQVLHNPQWRSEPVTSYLPALQKEKLEVGVASLLLLMAQAQMMEREFMPDGRRQWALDQALELNAAAEKNGAAEHLPRSLWTQRATLLAMRGDAEKAEKVRHLAENAKSKNKQDAYLVARKYIVEGKYRKALPLLRKATEKDPKLVPPWFLKGRCHIGLGQENDAISCFTICIALKPNIAQPYFQRGLTYLRARQNASALKDFSKVIVLEPNNVNALINRALAFHAQGQTPNAIKDLDNALESGAPYTRVYFLRSRFRQKVGDEVGAKKDHEEGLQRTPKDDQSWNARGFAKLTSDPNAALGDFRQALKVNPKSLAAMANIAHVLHTEGKIKGAIAMLDQLVTAYPDYLPGRSGRGLLLAHTGQRDGAVKDAKACLKRSDDPANLYRVSCIYALSSKIEAKDRKRALRLLRTALRQGYGYELLERDPNLAPLRTSTEYRRLVSAIRILREKR